MAESRYGSVSWKRMVSAVERVRERLLRAAGALDAAGVPYAVAGGNAVAAWVSRVDEAAVRNTQDVDILLRRGDLDRASRALEGAGFHYVSAAPDVTESEPAPAFRLLNLEALVRMKLTSFRDQDRVHLRDLIEVGLVDASWRAKLHAPPAERLQQILDSPEG